MICNNRACSKSLLGLGVTLNTGAGVGACRILCDTVL